MNKKMKVTERDNDDETDEIFTILGHLTTLLLKFMIFGMPLWLTVMNSWIKSKLQKLQEIKMKP